MRLGIGDDAAAVSLPGVAVVSCDMLIEGTHFGRSADPYYLGRKSLAVNLSDMAAMGAAARYFLLALALPAKLVNSDWIKKFARGLHSLAKEQKLALIGGDLASSDLVSISVTVIGTAGEKLLRRDGARKGDELWLSGRVGGAGLELRKGARATSRSRLHNPTARTGLGLELAALATAAIDLSDGFAVGAQQLAQASGCRLLIDGRAIPLAKECPSGLQGMCDAICSGEDYELLFTATPSQNAKLASIAKQQKITLTKVGKVAIGKQSEISYGKEQMRLQTLIKKSYQHFSSVDEEDAAMDTNSLVTEIATMALAKKAKIAVAESCTGGMLGAALTSVPGSSDWFVGGVLCYSNELKERLLSVDPRLIKLHGAVSSKVATQMAAGARELHAANMSVAITGVAGPASSESKPAGLVFIAWAAKGRTAVRKFQFAGDRESVRMQAVLKALSGLKVALA